MRAFNPLEASPVQKMTTFRGYFHVKNKTAMKLATAVVALGLTTSISHAGYFLPGETMGTSLDSPLPEGVFAVDLESYGRADQQTAATSNVGVNIPVLVWSTPYTFYGNRLEFLVALPFAHLDGAVNRVGAITYAFGPIIGHDFGGGLTGGLSAFVRTPTPSQNILALDGRTVAEGDFRESLRYDMAGGWAIMENAGITTSFNHSSLSLGQNDFIAGDFTIQKTFEKLTLGFTGYGTTDLENRVTNFVVGPRRVGRQSQIELGGLVGYDFGRFLVRGIVVRSVVNDFANVRQSPETRGFFVVTVPLYVAPSPIAPVVARY